MKELSFLLYGFICSVIYITMNWRIFALFFDAGSWEGIGLRERPTLQCRSGWLNGLTATLISLLAWRVHHKQRSWQQNGAGWITVHPHSVNNSAPAPANNRTVGRGKGCPTERKNKIHCPFSPHTTGTLTHDCQQESPAYPGWGCRRQRDTRWQEHEVVRGTGIRERRDSMAPRSDGNWQSQHRMSAL